MQPNETPSQEKLHDLLKQFSTVMLVTHGASDEMRARPMAVAGLDADCGMWFFSNHESAKVHEITHDTRANVVCSQGGSVFLNVAGGASLSNDPAKIEALWNEAFKVWFPGGKDDPELTLIHFVPDRAEYWDNQGVNKLSYLWQSMKAYVTGTTPQVEEGEQHGVVRV